MVRYIMIYYEYYDACNKHCFISVYMKLINHKNVYEISNKIS